MKKVILAAEAAALIEDGATVGIGGFGVYGAPETLLRELSLSYDTVRRPQNLNITCGVCPGNNTKDAFGLNRIAKAGLIKSIIAGHFANPPLIAEMIAENQIAGYALPLGVMFHLYDAIAGHKPAVLTRVGLGTYADPRNEGCRCNDRAIAEGREIVSLVDIGEEKCLAYKTFPIDYCMVRATYADEDGNLSMEDEAVGDYVFDMIAATHNSGGVVIAEVKEVVKKGTLHPKRVRVHSHMVDYVVIADKALYMQGYAAKFRPELSGAIHIPTGSLQPMEMSNRKIIARRGAMELTPDCLINLGIGIPSGIGSVANEEGVNAVLSLESGPQGGVPLEGDGFGASVNADVIYNMSDVFHLYDGGILSMTFLGAAEIDARGNVNVSKFGKRCAGPGGFINISQNTPKVCFVGTFTTGGLEEEVRDGRLVILKEGAQKKFRENVQQITFSGEYAKSTAQDVMYITERAVFELSPDGLMLTEIAPGVDLQKDVLDQMEFMPLIAPELKLMDGRIFHKEKMGIFAGEKQSD